MEKKVDWQTAYKVANADIYRLLEAAGLGEPHVGTVEQAVDAIIRFREEAAQAVILLEALEECVDVLEYLATAPDSDYARPDEEVIKAAHAAIRRAKGEG